jgi:hypothetical protein
MLRPMRFAPLALACLLVPTLAFVPACKRREEAPPPPPPPAKPVSIWGSADAQAIAGLMVASATRDPWTSQYRDRNNRPARVAVGDITDNSGKNVDVGELAAAIAQALGNGGDKLALAGTAQPDFVLSGVIGASAGTLSDGTSATFFAIDLSFADAASQEIVWHFAIERPIADR